MYNHSQSAAPGQPSNQSNTNNNTIYNNVSPINEEQAIKVKIVLLGDQKVGKSSIIAQYISKKIVDQYQPTVGVDFATKTLKIDNKSYKLQIWDTARQKRFQAITSAYYKGGNAMLIVYDKSKSQSFKEAPQFIKKARQYCQSAYICLVGNKSDLQSVVSTQVGMKLAQEQKVDYIQISAKNQQQVQNLFLRAVKYIHQNH